MHRRYKELCALAATRQIDVDDDVDLLEHLKSCKECRALLADMVQVSTQGVALVAASRAESLDIQPPAGIRGRFLERASAEGFKLAPGPPFAPSWTPASQADLPRNAPSVKLHAIRRMWLRLYPIEPLHGALALAACALFGLLGYLLAQQRYSTRPAPPPAAALNTTEASGSVDPGAQQAEQQKVLLEQELHTISARLAAAEAGKVALSRKLADVVQQAAAGAQFEQQFRQATKDLQDAEDQVAKLKSDLEVAKQQRSDTESALVAQRRATQDANAKLAVTESQLRTEYDIRSARSEIGDLISARNLHIVDINDHEPGGKRGRAFGRVFYVEGQSLVFYAYDLATPNHQDKKVTFQMWGETAGVKATTYSLGILHSDDPSQARWILTFDDPRVLNRINAVYITAEHGAPSKGEPQGRTILYAFLGNPNHP